jgi:hypothetical protein
VHAKWLLASDYVTEVPAKDQEIETAIKLASAVQHRIQELGHSWISQVFAVVATFTKQLQDLDGMLVSKYPVRHSYSETKTGDYTFELPVFLEARMRLQ